MVIYSNNKESDADKIAYSDLIFMTKKLGDFINIYREKIYIDDPETRESLNKLEIIYQKLKNKQYNLLINDTSIIDYDININDKDDTNPSSVPF